MYIFYSETTSPAGAFIALNSLERCHKLKSDACSASALHQDLFWPDVEPRYDQQSQRVVHRAAAGVPAGRDNGTLGVSSDPLRHICDTRRRFAMPQQSTKYWLGDEGAESATFFLFNPMTSGLGRNVCTDQVIMCS